MLAFANAMKRHSMNTSACIRDTRKAATQTSADGFAVIPRTVFGTTDGGCCDRFHEIAGVTLIAHSLIEGEIHPKLDAIGQCTWVPTAYN